MRDIKIFTEDQQRVSSLRGLYRCDIAFIKGRNGVYKCVKDRKQRILSREFTEEQFKEWLEQYVGENFEHLL
jgi:hypothetical protein